MGIGGNGSRRVSSRLFAAAAVLLAVRLFIPAAVLAFSPGPIAEFNSTGLPGWSRLGLALPEMVGAILLAVPRTFYAGTLVLFLDLAGAILAHLYIGASPVGLYLLVAGLVALAGVRRCFVG